MQRRIIQVSLLLVGTVLALPGLPLLLTSNVSATAQVPANANRENSAAIKESFDAHAYYRLTTQWLGDGKSLDIVNDGKNNNQVILANTGDFAGQRWRIAPVGQGYYRLTSEWQGDGKSIDVVNDGKNNQLILATTGRYSGQFWKITSLGGGYFRLSTLWQGAGRSLDIVNDLKNNQQLILADTSNYSGQIWKITRVK